MCTERARWRQQQPPAAARSEREREKAEVSVGVVSTAPHCGALPPSPLLPSARATTLRCCSLACCFQFYPVIPSARGRTTTPGWALEKAEFCTRRQREWERRLYIRFSLSLPRSCVLYEMDPFDQTQEARTPKIPLSLVSRLRLCPFQSQPPADILPLSLSISVARTPKGLSRRINPGPQPPPSSGSSSSSRRARPRLSGFEDPLFPSFCAPRFLFSRCLRAFLFFRSFWFFCF